MIVATHNGLFHADDVLAVAMLQLAHADFGGCDRTRDPKLLAKADIRVDVGGRYDPATNDYDHHQGAGSRPNGIKYAAAGLVWKTYGEQLCGGDERAATLVDRRLIQPVDAADNGQLLSTGQTFPGVTAYGLTLLVHEFNPTWLEDSQPEAANAHFVLAVELCLHALSRCIDNAVSETAAVDQVRKAHIRPHPVGVLVLEQYMPWQPTVIAEYPDILYAVFRSTDQWMVVACPPSEGSTQQRKPLPREWCGLDGPTLARVTGVADAVFCHKNPFCCAAQSREGAIQLAQLAAEA